MSKYYDKTAASFKSVTIDTKVLDAQKILINSDPDDINLRENLIDVLNEIDVTPSYTSYQYIDYCEKPSTTGTCSAIKLNANLLPNDKDIKAIRLDVANTVNTETWLVAYLVDANNNFTSIGKSINSNTWSTGDLVEWEFEETFRIPEGSYLQLYIADANSTISANNVTRPSYKIGLYAINDYSGDNPDSVRYDGTWYSPRRVYVQFKEEIKLDLASKLGETVNELTNHIGDSAHLTTSDRTLLNNLANGYTLGNIVSVIEYYLNGATWARKYSDGWVEQGGEVAVRGSDKSWITVSFPISFTGTNYTIITSSLNADDNINYTDSGASIKSKTTTSCQLRNWDYQGNTWYACGY